LKGHNERVTDAGFSRSPAAVGLSKMVNEMTCFDNQISEI